MNYHLGNTVISLIKGDITLEGVEVIVNAANNALRGGGGVDGAIHRAAGPGLMSACREIGNCSTGSAVITPGYNLAAPYVIHTVGPVYADSADDPLLLASCYSQSLKLAMEHKLRTIAFPSISTGVYGYPLHLAAPVAMKAILEFVRQNPDAFDLVRMVLFDEHTLQAYEKALEQLRGQRGQS